MAMTSNGVKKKIAIIQARMGSSRMPGKILKEIAGKPVLWHLLENIKHSRELTDIVVATTGKKEDDALEEFAREYGVNYFRGSEDNVLERFHEAAKAVGASDADIIVRITADCILNCLMSPRSKRHTKMQRRNFKRSMSRRISARMKKSSRR